MINAITILTDATLNFDEQINKIPSFYTDECLQVSGQTHFRLTILMNSASVCGCSKLCDFIRQDRPIECWKYDENVATNSHWSRIKFLYFLVQIKIHASKTDDYRTLSKKMRKKLLHYLICLKIHHTEGFHMSLDLRSAFRAAAMQTESNVVSAIFWKKKFQFSQTMYKNYWNPTKKIE